MDRRGPVLARPAPGSFRCLVCKEFVRGTEIGHCPRCGFVPPSALRAQDPPPVWSAMLLVHIALVVGIAVLLARLL